MVIEGFDICPVPAYCAWNVSHLTRVLRMSAQRCTGTHRVWAQYLVWEDCLSARDSSSAILSDGSPPICEWWPQSPRHCHYPPLFINWFMKHSQGIMETISTFCQMNYYSRAQCMSDSMNNTFDSVEDRACTHKRAIDWRYCCLNYSMLNPSSNMH